MNIAITGHREYHPELLRRPLLDEILNLCREHGACRILCGMAHGFDIAVGEAAIEAQKLGAEIELHCIIPFAGHNKNLNPAQLTRYNNLTQHSSKCITLEDHYFVSVFHRRNDYLLQHAQMVLAYHNGTKKGGTAYTIRHATKLHIPIKNIYPLPQLTLQL